MLQLKHPGVYTQELPSGVRPITGASTSVALFVGPTVTGIDDRPIRIFSFADFERAFGGLSQTSNLSYSVLHFFANGGSEAYVLRVPPEGAVAASSGFKRADTDTQTSLTVTALSSGVASNEIFVSFDAFGIEADPFGEDGDAKRFNMTITDRATGRVERFGDISTSSSSARFAPLVVNDAGLGSQIVSVEVNGIDNPAPETTGSVYAIGTAPTPGTFGGDVKVKLSVTFPKADGTPDPVASIDGPEITVFHSGKAQPATPLELAKKLTAAIAGAIAEDETLKAKMGDYAVVATAEEGGAFLRLMLSAPVGSATQARRTDGTVTLSAPTSGTNLIATYGLDAKTEGPSRYQLGAKYPAAHVNVSGLVPGATGQSHGQPTSDDFKSAISALEEPDPFFNILCLPDIVRPSPGDPNAPQHSNYGAVYGEAARICDKKFAFLLIDPPPDVSTYVGAEAWKSGRFTFASEHAAAYFPNIRVDEPLVPGSIRTHPPSGAIAGLYARTDAEAGVWQAPAGTNAVLTGVYGPAVELSDSHHGVLNPVGLNVIRKFPIYGTVAFGSRTVDGADAKGSEYKYIPVRRTANYILRSLSEGLRWAVHQPNGDELWSQIRVNVNAFMQRLFRAGAFKGVTAQEAFFVACDASTTPQIDIDLGIVNVVVGFAPLKPAEFVVISLQQMVQAAE
mgnify:CR=1 FL=1